MSKIKLFREYQEIFTNDRFWGTVGAGILPFCVENGKFLIPLRSKYVNEPRTYGVWGGKLDDMETNDPQEAALTEFQEECGYSGEIKMIPSYVYKKKDHNGKDIFTYYNYIGIIEKEFTPTLDWETESYLWLTLDELYDLTPKHFGLQGLLDNAKDQIKEVYSLYS